MKVIGSTRTSTHHLHVCLQMATCNHPQTRNRYVTICKQAIDTRPSVDYRFVTICRQAEHGTSFCRSAGDGSVYLSGQHLYNTGSPRSGQPPGISANCLMSADLRFIIAPISPIQIQSRRTPHIQTTPFNTKFHRDDLSSSGVSQSLDKGHEMAALGDPSVTLQ